MDRRVKRTRNNLIQALPNLMRRYEWDTINIQLLCDHADVSRSAFYTHFKSKSDVLEHCFYRLEEELLESTENRGLDSHGTLQFIPNLLSHVESHCDLLKKNASSAGGLVILNRFRSLVKNLTKNEFDGCSSYQLGVDQLTFITGGTFAMLEQWNEEQCETSVKALTERIDALVDGHLRN